MAYAYASWADLFRVQLLQGASLRPLLTEALSFAQRAVELDPSDPLIQIIRAAWQLMIERDFDGAVARHEDAFRKIPIRCGFAAPTALLIACAGSRNAPWRCSNARGASIPVIQASSFGFRVVRSHICSLADRSKRSSGPTMPCGLIPGIDLAIVAGGRGDGRGAGRRRPPLRGTDARRQPGSRHQIRQEDVAIQVCRGQGIYTLGPEGGRSTRLTPRTSSLWPLATLRSAQLYVGNWGLSGQRADISTVERMTQLRHAPLVRWAFRVLLRSSYTFQVRALSREQSHWACSGPTHNPGGHRQLPVFDILQMSVVLAGFALKAKTGVKGALARAQTQTKGTEKGEGSIDIKGWQGRFTFLIHFPLALMLVFNTTIT